MVSRIRFSFLNSYFLLLFSFSIAQTPFRPRALVLPVTKDAATGQYIAQISQRTPLVPVKLTIHLGGQYLWVNCFDGYVSSSYKPAHCRSAPCNLARSMACSLECGGPEVPGCNNNTCYLIPGNPYISTATFGEVSKDVIALQSTDGSNPGPVVSAPPVIFSCTGRSLVEGLADGVKGMAGLGRDPIGLPFQLASAFSFPKKFAICLSSSTSSKGVIFFGDGPYNFLPGQDISKGLAYTPLLKNPVSTAESYWNGEPSSEYFIEVKSIKVNNQVVPINTTFLKFDKVEGIGGTKISTVVRYTTLETSIYAAITNAFSNSISKVPRESPVAPFTFCYKSSSLGSTRVGPGVPPIELVLPNGVSWTIFGGNSMVPVTNDVLCLGLVDGGPNPRTSIVIGAHQIEDNLLQFDLASTRLGFSSTLLGRQTNCANFNFTSFV